MEKSPHVFISLKALVSHAECITTIFIIQLCVVFELSSVKHDKTSLPKKQAQVLDPFRDVTEGPVRVLSMVDNGDSASSFATSDNDLFLSTFVDYFTDIAMLITTFLIHMSVLAGQGAPIPFSMKFSMNRGLNSE